MTTIPGPGGLGIAVNPVENKVYVAYCGVDGHGGSTFCIHDRDTGVTTSANVANDATELFFNPVSNRVYSDSEIGGVSSILDGATDAFFNLPMPSSTTALAVRQATNHVYYVGRKFVGILDDATQLLEMVPVDNPTPGSTVLQDIAINQATGRVFVLNDNALNFVTVLQDSPKLGRPPLYLGNEGPPRSRTCTFWIRSPGRSSTPRAHRQLPVHPLSRRPPRWRAGVRACLQFLRVRPGGLRRGRQELAAGQYRHGWILRLHGLGGRRRDAGRQQGLRDELRRGDRSRHRSGGEVGHGDHPGGQPRPGVWPSHPTARRCTWPTGARTASRSSAPRRTPSQAPSPSARVPGASRIEPLGHEGLRRQLRCGEVSVISTATDSVIATVPVGTTPHWLTVTPDGQQVFVGNRGASSVSVIDTATNVVIDTLTGVTNPEGIVARPDGSEIYVVNYATSGSSSLTVIKRSDHTQTTHVLTAIGTSADTTGAIGLGIADPTSRIAGRVTQGGSPVPGVLVRALQGGVEKSTATSDAAGDYSIFDLLPGTYDVEVVAPARR